LHSVRLFFLYSSSTIRVQLSVETHTERLREGRSCNCRLFSCLFLVLPTFSAWKKVRQKARQTCETRSRVDFSVRKPTGSGKVVEVRRNRQSDYRNQLEHKENAIKQMKRKRQEDSELEKEQRPRYEGQRKDKKVHGSKEEEKPARKNV